MNKIVKNLLSLVALSLIAVSLFAAPTSLSGLGSSSLATVRVGNKTQTITQADFDKKKEQYRKAGSSASDKEILDVLINDAVFLLNAEKDGVVITDSAIDAQIAQVRQGLEANTGKPITDAEFESLITAQYGATMTEVRNALKEQAILTEYLRMKRPNELNKTFTVTDAEINSFYRQNSTQFVSPEAVRISHVFKKEATSAAENQANLKTLQSVLSNIRGNRIAFEAAVQQYSDEDSANSKSRGGDIGYVTYSAISLMGEDFVNAAMGLEIGQVYTSVLHSPLGYHIIKATAKSPQKFLTLNDKVSPDSQYTVKEYIREGLTQQKTQENYVSVTNALVDELRASAKINILKQL